jgi:NAD(P)-dependent dehydrogenase (short-subunit alcohol dehydrogenase family)
VNLEGLAQTCQLAQKANGSVTVSQARVDTGKREEIYAWAEATRAEHGMVNLIFNNAGVALSSPLESVKQADFDWIMNINFWGVVWGSQAFLPHLKAAGEGHIVNTSSLFGLLSTPFNGPYNASKFAVRGYTEALRMELELSKAKVSATCVHPGGIRTNIARAARVDSTLSAALGMDLEAARKRFDRMLDRTTARDAALQILSGVERNARRVLVGADAKVFDLVVRVIGSWYQPIVERATRGMDER